MEKTIFYWHIYHNELLTFLTGPVKQRRKYIIKSKPSSEVFTRLKLLRRVKGRLPKELLKAAKIYRQRLFGRGWGYNLNEVKNKYKLVLDKYQDEINELHREECKECPWNGKDIFYS